MAVTKVKNDGVDFSEASSIAFDTTTLFVDATNDRVGIGTTSPSVELSIAGSDPQLILWEGTDGASSSKVQLGTGTVQGFINIHKGDGTRTVQINSSGDTYFTGGNVGVGTTSPSTILHIDNTSDPIVRLQRGGAAYSQFQSDSGGSLFISADAGNSGASSRMQFNVDGAEKMRIDSSGNVGIGTTSLSDKLTVAGTVAISDQLTVTKSSTGTTLNRMQRWLHSGENVLDLNMYGGSTDLVQFAVWNSEQNISIVTDSSGSIDATNTKGIYIKSGGNVGIGTTSPGSRFEVVHNSTPIAKFTGATNAYVDFTDGTVTTRLQNSGATYFGTTTNHGMIFRSNATDRMIVASDGKVGIGTNAPVEGNLVVRNDSGDSKINIKVNSFAGTNGIAALDFSTGGQAGTDPQARIHAIGQNNYSADLVFSTQISGTSNPLSERMRILSNGRVVIGTTSAVAWNRAQGNIFAVAGSQNTISSLQTSSTSANQGCIYEAYATATTSGSPAIGSIAFLRENTSTTAVRGYAAFYTNRDGNIAEKMRLASDGHLSLNTTSDVVGGKGCKFALNQAIASGYAFGIDAVRNTNDSGGILIKNGDTQGTHYAVSFFNTSNSFVGSIVTSNGGTSFNTSSDYRLKENVVDLDGAIERLNQLKPHRFNFIADPDKTVDGFIAHEVSDVVPEAIHGEKDAVDTDGNIISQGIDQAKLVPLLTAALQEAIAEIENLKTRIEAIENA